MNSHETYWYDSLAARAVIFSYTGVWSEHLFTQLQTTLADILQPHLSTHQWRRVRLTTLELGQNLLWYAPQQHHAPYAALNVSWEAPHVIVRCANTIHAHDYSRLQAQLQPLSAYNNSQLRAAYRTQLQALPDPHSRGAGLGWLTVARLVSQPLETQFYPHDDDYLLCLTATI